MDQNHCLDQFGISRACDGTLHFKFLSFLPLIGYVWIFSINRRIFRRECDEWVLSVVKNLKPLRKTVNLLGRNSARRASELRKHTGRASFSYTNFVLQTHGIQEEMWKEIQAFWREKKVYDKFTQLRRKHFRHFLSYLINH